MSVQEKEIKKHWRQLYENITRFFVQGNENCNS